MLFADLLLDAILRGSPGPRVGCDNAVQACYCFMDLAVARVLWYHFAISSVNFGCCRLSLSMQWRSLVFSRILSSVLRKRYNELAELLASGQLSTLLFL